jgi:hypothetical protein
VRHLAVSASPVEAGAAVRARELDAIDDGLALAPARTAFVFAVTGRPQRAAFAVHESIAQDLAFARAHEDARTVF